jgi:hypothetical protein
LGGKREWINGRGKRVRDLFLRGPEIAQENRRAIFADSKRLGFEIDVGRTGERERDDERRRHEEVRLHVLMHARLEVAVARKHAGGDEIVLHDASSMAGSSGPELPMQSEKSYAVEEFPWTFS